MNAEPHEDLRTLLDQAILLLNTRGAEAAHASEQLSALKCRLAEGQFNLAVLGQFKRGKSTLLNVPLGEEILPTAVVPLTAIPTFIRHGDFLKAHNSTMQTSARLTRLMVWRGICSISIPLRHRSAKPRQPAWRGVR